MANHGVVDFHMRLPVEYKQEGDWTIASCPVLDVHSQGRSEEEAKRNIVEALQLFIESCFERGTLDDVLKEAGFSPADKVEKMPQNGHTVDVPLHLVAA